MDPDDPTDHSIERDLRDHRPAHADDDHGRDEQTAREGLELELMDEGASEAGEEMGDEVP